MTQNIDNILTWKNTLGLLPIKQFSGDIHKDKYILLNGGNGDLCLDISPTKDSREFYFSSAWSSNVKNFIVAQKDNIEVYNWKNNEVNSYRSDQVINNLVKFHSYLINSSYKASDDVVPFVISIFRRLRNLCNDVRNPLDSLNQLFLLLSSLNEGLPQDYSAWGIDGDVVPHPELGKYIEEFKKGVSGIKPELDLIFRHSLGVVFQEAQKEVLLFDKQMTLFSYDTLSDIYQTRKILYSSIHHTPSYLARCIVENALNRQDLLNKKTLKIFDPSCGASEFLIEVLKQLESRNYEGNVSISGWDNSETAIKTSRFLLTYEKRNWYGKMEFDLRLVSDSLSEVWGSDFDIILMNPPFVSWEQLKKEDRDVVSNSLGRVFDGKPNQASAFFYKAIRALGPDGVLGTVIPSSLLSLDAYKKLRAEISEITTINLIGKLGNYVFEDALVDVSILIASKPKTNTPPLVIWTNNEKGIAVSALSEFRKMLYSNSPSMVKPDFSIYRPTYDFIDSWKPISSSENSLYNKLNNLVKIGRLVPVEDIFNVQQGIRTGNNNVFKISEREYNDLPKSEKRYFRAAIDNESIKDGQIFVQNYVWYPYDEEKILFNSENELIENIPIFYNYKFKNYKDSLKNRARKDDLSWWHLSEHRAWLRKKEPRLVSTEFGKSDSFAFDKGGSFVVERGNAWLPKNEFADLDDYYFYLAIFSSPFFDKLLSIYSKQLAGGNWYDLGKKFTKNIPIPKLSEIDNIEDEELCLNRESHIYKKLAQFGKEISVGEFYDHSQRQNLITEFIYPVL